MIKQILDLLALQEHYGQSEIIEIAKGKNELPRNYSALKTKIKRQWQTLKR